MPATKRTFHTVTTELGGAELRLLVEFGNQHGLSRAKMARAMIRYCLRAENRDAIREALASEYELLTSPRDPTGV